MADLAASKHDDTFLKFNVGLDNGIDLASFKQLRDEAREDEARASRHSEALSDATERSLAERLKAEEEAFAAAKVSNGTRGRRASAPAMFARKTGGLDQDLVVRSLIIASSHFRGACLQDIMEVSFSCFLFCFKDWLSNGGLERFAPQLAQFGVNSVADLAASKHDETFLKYNMGLNGGEELATFMQLRDMARETFGSEAGVSGGTGPRDDGGGGEGDEDDDTAPKAFQCPISCTLMRDPVRWNVIMWRSACRCFYFPDSFASLNKNVRVCAPFAAGDNATNR